MLEIADQAVRYVHRGMRQSEQPPAKGEPWLREAVARRQRGAMLSAEPEEPALDRLEAERPIADGARYEDPVPGPRVAAEHAPPGGDRAKRRHRECERARRRDGIAAGENDAVSLLIQAQALREAREPGIVERRRHHQRQGVDEGPRPLRGEIGEIDAEELARHQVRRVLDEEMDPGDERV